MTHVNVRQFKVLGMVVIALVANVMLAACGRFETAAPEKVSATADPLTAEKQDQQDAAKDAQAKKKDSAVAAKLFKKERGTSDAALLQASDQAKAQGETGRAQALISIASVHRFNETIQKQRVELLRLAELATKPEPSVTAEEKKWLKTIATEYKVTGETPTKELRLRVDGWPGSLILASLFIDKSVDPKVGATEKEVSERMTKFNTSGFQELIVLRWQRSLLNANEKMSLAEKAKMLAPEYAKSLVAADREPFVKLVEELSAVEGATK